MATFARITLVGFVVLTVITLSGCLGAPPTAVMSPSPSVVPVFASEEEALAAATEAYAAYLKVSDAIAQDGWSTSPTIETVVGGVALEEDLRVATEFRQRGYLQVGDTAFDGMTVQSVSDALEGGPVVTTYVCLDVSAVQIVDPAGTSIIPVDRPSQYPLELGFSADSGTESGLILVRSASWAGEDFC